jgi:hypothetical protein
MSDNAFKYALTTLALLTCVSIVVAISLASVGIYWIGIDFISLIFLTILTGLIILIAGGITLLYFWGRRYMSKL